MEDLSATRDRTTTNESWMMDSGDTSCCNIAAHLPRMAATVPDNPAIVVTSSRDAGGYARYASLTFAELEALSNRYANGLREAGFERGMRVLVMVRPGFSFVALAFALFKLGVVSVMIDPGMGVRRMLDCIRSVDLHGFIGVPLAHVMRIVHRGSFRSARRVVTVGRRWCWGGPTLQSLQRGVGDAFAMADTNANETAAILFTSGSTGPAKGVVYKHGMFDAQVRLIQSHYGIEPGEVDLPALPLFALLSTAMGMTSVIPDMDPSHPARVDPVKIVEAIRDHKVTNTFGSPAIWKRVASYCILHNVKLPSLRRILIAGAPVPWSLIHALHQVLVGDVDVHTPYGATESLPVSTVCGREVLGSLSDRSRKGAGTCVGRPLPGIEVRVIRITDDPIENWSGDLCVPEGEAGEIVVTGPVVTKEYFGLPVATALAKIREGTRIWHRIGDIGYRDSQGRLWFCGRKSQRVLLPDGTMFADQCEAIFNDHPKVARSALVGVGRRGAERPVIIIEPETGCFPRGPYRSVLREEILEIGRSHTLTKMICDVLFHRSLPVDVRHNVKINREALTVWASRRLRR